MKPLAQLAAALLGAIPAYFAGWLLWMAGQWAGIVPASRMPHHLPSALLPPLALVVAWVAWVAAWRWRTETASRRRLVQFGLAAVASLLVSIAQLVWETASGDSSGRHRMLPAAISFILMMSVAAAALLVDRDVELSLRIVLLTLLAVIPVVALGRLVAILVAMTAYNAVRA